MFLFLQQKIMNTQKGYDMSVELKNTFTVVSQTAFFSNSQNKQQLIGLLAVQLEAEHHTVVFISNLFRVIKKF